MNKKTKYTLGAIILIATITAAIFLYRGTKKDYEVSFIVNGEIFHTQYDELKEVEEPEKVGHTFKGWYYNGKKIDITKAKITEDMTLEAQFERIKDVYILEINIDDIKTEVVTNKEGIIEEIEIPQKEGYEFEGWYINDEKIDISKPFTSDAQIKAKWRKIESEQESAVETPIVEDNQITEEKPIVEEKPNVEEKIKEYKVEYVVDGITVKTETLKENSKLTLPTNPAKTGYTFNGWYLNNTKVSSNTKITNNIKVIAKWDIYTFEIKEINNDLFSVNRLLNVYKNGTKIYAKTIYGTYNNQNNYKLGIYSTKLNGIKVVSYEQFKKSTNYQVELENGSKVYINEK